MRSLLYNYLHHFDRKARVGPASSKLRDWLESLALPALVHELMSTSWPQRPGSLGAFYIKSSTELAKDQDLPRLLDHGLLKIGSGPNGDLLVLDLKTEDLVPGVVEHGKFWGQEPEDDDPRAFHEPIARTFASLFFRVDEERYVPCDYWAAVDFNAFMSEEDAGRDS